MVGSGVRGGRHGEGLEAWEVVVGVPICPCKGCRGECKRDPTPVGLG